jgi:hypothetical protein
MLLWLYGPRRLRCLVVHGKSHPLWLFHHAVMYRCVLIICGNIGATPEYL